MKETWYSWVYLMSRQENEPLPGHLEIDGGGQCRLWNRQI